MCISVLFMSVNIFCIYTFLLKIETVKHLYPIKVSNQRVSFTFFTWEKSFECFKLQYMLKIGKKENHTFDDYCDFAKKLYEYTT